MTGRLNLQLLCPACGVRERHKPQDKVCPECIRVYQKELGAASIQGKTFPFWRWVRDKARTLHERLSAELAQKQADVKTLQQEVEDEVSNGFVHASAEDEGSDLREFGRKIQHANGQKKKELWQARGGNRLWAEKCALEDKVNVLAGVMEGFRQQDAERQQKQPENKAEAMPASVPQRRSPRKKAPKTPKPELAEAPAA